jgi:hypothetical protein
VESTKHIVSRQGKFRDIFLKKKIPRNFTGPIAGDQVDNENFRSRDSFSNNRNDGVVMDSALSGAGLGQQSTNPTGEADRLGTNGMNLWIIKPNRGS